MPPTSPRYEQQLADAGIKGAALLQQSDGESGRTTLEASVAGIQLSVGQIGEILLYIETTRAVSPVHRSVEMMVAVLFIQGDKSSGARSCMVAEKTYLPLIQSFPRIDQIVEDLVTIYCQKEPAPMSNKAEQQSPKV